MYIDLNVPVPQVATIQSTQQSKKGKGKQPPPPANVVFTPGQLTELEARVDFLSHLGYTVIAFNQTVQRKVEPKTHVNVLDPLLAQLRKRTSIAYVKRLTIVLDEESEKGFGLTSSNASLFSPYDLIALLPTTSGSFSLACLTHTLPSPLTAHIISLPLTLPRLAFNLKHTLVRTALKNGAIFEIAYAGSLGGEHDPSLGASAAGESGASGKRNWWAGAREVVRVTKGKGIIVTSGAVNQVNLRSPKDVGNLISMLDLPQNLAHDALTKTPQAIILRAQTRRTYRAVFSEPRLVIPEGFATKAPTTTTAPGDTITQMESDNTSSEVVADVAAQSTAGTPLVLPPKPTNGKKRPLEADPTIMSKSNQAEENSKKKRKEDKGKAVKTS